MPRADEWLSEKELQVARKFEKELIALFKDCEKKDGYTIEAAPFHQEYRDGTSAGKRLSCDRKNRGK
jgi:hypothetical protein